MRRLASLKLTYAVAWAIWLAYVVIKLFLVSTPDRNPNLSGALYCFLLLGVVPPAVGYVLLFKFVPWAGRTLRKA